LGKINYKKMKKRLNLITTILLSAAALSLSSCLKDSRYVDLTKVGTIVEFPFGGQVFFGSPYEALAPADTIVTQFAVNVASPTVPTTATPITFEVDNPATVAAYNAKYTTVTYLVMPANAYVFTQTSVTVAAGRRDTAMTLTIYGNLLDPSKSYMLPITIKTAGGLNISGNQNTMYYHIIGNDFAGAYTWDYRRWQNGTGPGAGQIPSQGQGIPPDITGLGQAGSISAISPTEFQMLTGYNNTGVMYDVTFDRSVDGSGVVHYTNWNVIFNAANLALWTNAGITNHVPPAFTVPPPATSADPKFFELNYVSGGASARYIDDTYHK
jgi:hypothetical protein